MISTFIESLPAIAAFLFIGGAISAMAFFGLIVSPLAIRVLGDDQAGPFLRAIFPAYYVYFIALSALSALMAILADARFAAALLALITLGFVYARFALSPGIGHAREEGKSALSRRLRARALFLNGLQLAGFVIALGLLAGRV